jgi:hypothetical protein
MDVSLTYTRGLDPGDMVALLHYAAECSAVIVGVETYDCLDPEITGPALMVRLGETPIISDAGCFVDAVRPFLGFVEHAGIDEVTITKLTEGRYWPRAIGVVGSLHVEISPAHYNDPLWRELYESNQPVPGEHEALEPSALVPLAEVSAAVDAAVENAKENATA